MALVLAIEPDIRQANILKRIVRELVMADLILVESRDAAIASINQQIPDVILLTALMSPRDEDELVAHLRRLGAAEHLQTHTIPLLSGPRDPGPVVQGRPARKVPQEEGSGADRRLRSGVVRRRGPDVHRARGGAEGRSAPRPAREPTTRRRSPTAGRRVSAGRRRPAGGPVGSGVDRSAMRSRRPRFAHGPPRTRRRTTRPGRRRSNGNRATRHPPPPREAAQAGATRRPRSIRQQELAAQAETERLKMLALEEEAAREREKIDALRLEAGRARHGPAPRGRRARGAGCAARRTSTGWKRSGCAAKRRPRPSARCTSRCVARKPKRKRK